jgi:hypothetical protein
MVLKLKLKSGRVEKSSNANQEQNLFALRKFEDQTKTSEILKIYNSSRSRKDRRCFPPRRYLVNDICP